MLDGTELNEAAELWKGPLDLSQVFVDLHHLGSGEPIALGAAQEDELAVQFPLVGDPSLILEVFQPPLL